MKSGVTDFAEWYSDRSVNERTGCIEFRNNSDYASAMKRKYMDFKREMDARCSNFHKFEMLADGEVISRKPTCPTSARAKPPASFGESPATWCRTRRTWRSSPSSTTTR